MRACMAWRGVCAWVQVGVCAWRGYIFDGSLIVHCAEIELWDARVVLSAALRLPRLLFLLRLLLAQARLAPSLPPPRRALLSNFGGSYVKQWGAAC